jgi:hypothetical protein
MLNKLVYAAIVLFWIGAMSWLVRHDVIPALTARDVPSIKAEGWLEGEKRESQARIEDKTGKRIGTIWSTHTAGRNGVSRSDVFLSERLPPLPRLRIQVDADFTLDGELDEVLLEVDGIGKRIKLEGENMSGNLAFILWVGQRRQLFKIDADAAGMLGDVFRPFPALPNIEVGQSWRMHVVNPLAAISGFGSKLIPMIVKVRARERLLTDQGAVECFVVETDHGARAWVDADGTVLRQEADVPIGGRLTVVAEPFNAEFLQETLSLPLPSGRRSRL